LSRIIPKCPAKPISTRPHELVYEIELITPMVGGGASSGLVDLDFPIRPTAIRGQLRHWWRLARGFELGSKMWRREEEIFGSTDFASPVVVSIIWHSKVEQFDPTSESFVGKFSPEAYALFASIENKQLVTKQGLEFKCRVTIADESELKIRRQAQNAARQPNQQLPQSIEPIEDDILSAMTTWLLFGGIGGRTRRGCGAILCKSVDEIAPPSLPAKLYLGAAQSSAMEAWKKSLSAYREFRQTPRGRKHNKTLANGKSISVPGRSHWPEADSIRKITSCALKPAGGTTTSTGVPDDENTHDHSTPVVPASLLPAFPKAVLGLPINFHFADGPNKGRAARHLDPKDAQIYPLLRGNGGELEKYERMASPVITRPILRDGKWYPAILVFDQTLPQGMAFRVEGKGALVAGDLSHDLSMSKVVDPSLRLLSPMRGKASALEALVEYIKSNGYTEVPV
jgi:CRISPR-associated protein Cmr1